jgi:hypothetical protein
MMSMKHGTKMEAVPIPCTIRPNTHIHRVLQENTHAFTGCTAHIGPDCMVFCGRRLDERRLSRISLKAVILMESPDKNQDKFKFG